MRIGEPARKHGIADADIQHAARHATSELPSPPNVLLLAGPARDGTLLEVALLDPDGDDPVVIHAMKLRPKFHRYLRS